MEMKVTPHTTQLLPAHYADKELLIRLPNTNPDLLRALCYFEENITLQVQLLLNPNTPEDGIKNLLTNNPAVRQRFTEHPALNKLPLEVVLQLIRNGFTTDYLKHDAFRDHRQQQHNELKEEMGDLPTNLLDELLFGYDFTVRDTTTT